MVVRAMGPEDLDAVEEIECQTLTPWSLTALRQELAVQEGLCFVAEAAERRIVGWCACRRIWPEAELLKLAVAEQERKKGFGTALLQCLIGDLQQEGFTVLFLEVRGRNKAALSFYDRHYFLAVGMRRTYYSDPPDDALLLRKDIC